jgi:hypothetical protein
VGPIAAVPVAPANTVLPVISGTTVVGSVLTASSGTWTGTATITYAYQWRRDGAAISGATASGYTLVTADIGAMITVTVTATNSVGSASAVSTGVGPVTDVVVSLTAPVLDLVAASDTGPSSTDNVTSDNTPDIDITFPDGAFAGDIVKLYDGVVLIGSHTITTGEALAAAFSVTLAALADGVHPLTATLTRGASVSPASATLSITIAPDPVTPTYTGPGDITGWGTAYGYWGMRGYNASKIGTGCIDVASNRTGAALNLTTINVGSDGYADLSAIGFSPIYVHKVWDQCGSTPQHLFFSGARPVIQTNAVGGKPTIRFDGGEFLVSTANCIALPQQYTIAEVVKFYSTLANSGTLTDGAFYLPLCRVSVANKIAINLGTFSDTTAVAADDVVHSVIVKANNASTTCSVNGLRTGVAGAVGAGGFANTNKLTMGAATDGGAGTLFGEIYEVILKAGAVTDPNQDLLTANQRAIGTGF